MYIAHTHTLYACMYLYNTNDSPESNICNFTFCIIMSFLLYTCTLHAIYMYMCVTCYSHVHVHADVVATPTPSASCSSQSLFSRLVSAITPSHLTRHAPRPSESTPRLTTTNCTPARSDKGRASVTDRSKFKTPSVHLRTNKTTTPASSVKLSNLPHKSGDIEMKDFRNELGLFFCFLDEISCL